MVLEDHPIFRDALVRCFEFEADFQVVGRFATGAVDVTTIEALTPHLVLLDIDIPGRDGIEAMKALRAVSPALPIVVLTGHPDGLLLRANEAGAVGYVLKSARSEELLATLRRVVGSGYLPQNAATRSRPEVQPEERKWRYARLPDLTPREIDVLRLLAMGDTNRQIAKHLFVSEETVKSHVAAILRKLQVADRTRAAIVAVRAGLLDV